MKTLSQIWERIKLPIVFILLLTSVIISIMAAYNVSYKNNHHDIMMMIPYSLFYYVLLCLCFMGICAFVDFLIDGEDSDDEIFTIWLYCTFLLPFCLIVFGGAVGLVVGIFIQALG